MTALTEQRRSTAAVLHGMHPLRGYEVTWHITALPADGKGRANFLVERADGRIRDDVAWSLAEKEIAVLSTAGVQELVRRATARRTR